jgi:hypothetical protein
MTPLKSRAAIKAKGRPTGSRMNDVESERNVE